MGGRWARAAALAAGAALGTLAARPAAGQGVDPRGDWRTIATPHFRVHFRAEHEALGRRAAGDAERAWTRLAAELTPPRGPVDVVVADNVDFSNGFARVTPTNRIVVYAQPPVDVASLRFYDDWGELLLVHELTHVFHLDRARGPWRVLQGVFGRNPGLFPNTYAPAWVTEGLAVYFESRVTGAGRVLGSEQRMLARAAALADRVPRLDQLSLESSIFPAGQQAYAYGSLVLDEAARAGRPGGVRAFVERTSAMLIPYRLNHAARRSFGEGLDAAWRRWRDSVRAEVAAAARRLDGALPAGAAGTAAEAPGWRTLTREGWNAAYPRWLDDERLVYAANDAREIPGAYRVTRDGARRRVGRRNSLAPSVPLLAGPHAGGLLFAQLDYVDPFTVRGDLYVQRDTTGPVEFGAASRGQVRLTRGARLAHPDARARDGAIVAVQSVAGTTRLVRVTPDGAAIAPLTRAAADTQWAEPRWAPDGAHVAAARVVRGGRTAIVVLDTMGAAVATLAEERAVQGAPSWDADGRTLYWWSDRTGAPQLYAATLPCLPCAGGDDAPSGTAGAAAGPAATPAATPRRVSASLTGLTQPVPRPDGGALAALLFRADGLYVATAPLADSTAAVPTTAEPNVFPQRAPALPPARDTSRTRGYAPWRTLAPRYWTPLLAQGDLGTTLVGGGTVGEDVLARHRYAANGFWNVEARDVEGSASYRYARLGQPFLDLVASQGWQYDRVVVRRGTALDTTRLDRRTRQVGASLVFVRPRYRTSAAFSVGGFLETRGFRSSVPALADSSDARLGTTFPTVVVSGSWLNTRRPVRSVSPEDGVSLSFVAQQRWQDGSVLGGASRRAVGTARLYKSLDLPGYAHHVLALRVAGGAADARSASEFTVGGVSGTAAAVLPGVTVGDPSRPFAVRGFAPGAQRGLRAAAVALEYRAPLAIPARGLNLLPVFLDRLSVSVFGEAATAWCPAGVDRRVQSLCRRLPNGAPNLDVTPTAARWLASVGAELNLDAALQYDVGYRVRLGVAHPLTERARAGRSVVGYATLGFPF